MSLAVWKGYVVEHTWVWEMQCNGMVVLGATDQQRKESVTGVLCQSKSGHFYVDDKTIHCIKRKIEHDEEVTLVFVPHDNRVTHVCEKCFAIHFGLDSVLRRNLNFQCKSYKCSVCGKTPKYDGLLVRMGMVATLPLWTWKYDLDGLKAKIESQRQADKGAYIIESSQVYDGAKFILQTAKRSWRDPNVFEWELCQDECRVTATMPRPPHHEEWNKETPWDELKLIASKLQYRGAKTAIHWVQGEAERSFQIQ